MKRILFLVASLFIMYKQVAAQQAPLQPDAEGSLVKWITLQEAMEKTKTAPRPILMDFYTDWCGWCKKMMQTTYANPGLAQYINTNFYAVKFDAEGKDTIEYLGKKYAPMGTGPRTTHALAAKLLQNKMMYPTTLFMNNFDKTKNEFAFNMLAQGYLEAKKIEPLLVFELENVFRTSQYEDFEKEYNKAFYDSASAEKYKTVKWIKPTDFFGKQDSTKKKTLVLVHTEWCNACRVMQRTSFINEESEKFLNEKYDFVDFNPEITDALTFKGNVFSNPRSAQMPFHQLAVALCRNNITFPTLVVLDENMNVLDAVPYYLNPKVLKDITTYYGTNTYKTKSWTEYMKPTTTK